MAGITHKDVDALITYDAFSPLVLFGLERFGFCGPGEAREFVKNGRIELGGELPINTSGGLLSEGHVVGWNLFIEAVRQLRHECGERQVKDAQIVQYAPISSASPLFSGDRCVANQIRRRTRRAAICRSSTRKKSRSGMGAKQRRLVLQKCSDCANVGYPDRSRVSRVLFDEVRVERDVGSRALHNYVVYHKAWTPWLEKRVPYAVIQVELEEGPRLTTNLLECDIADIKIGMPVEQ